MHAFSSGFGLGERTRIHHQSHNMNEFLLLWRKMSGLFAFQEENPMRSYFVSIQTVPVPCRIHFPVMFYGGTIILFHAFTRTGAVVSRVEGDRGHKKNTRSSQLGWHQ